MQVKYPSPHKVVAKSILLMGTEQVYRDFPGPQRPMEDATRTK